MRNCKYCIWLDGKCCPRRSFSMLDIEAYGKQCYNSVPLIERIRRFFNYPPNAVSMVGTGVSDRTTR